MLYWYYISGVDLNWRRSIFGWVVVESGKEDIKYCSWKWNEKVEVEYIFKICKLVINEVYLVKELVESYISDDLNCSDVEDGKSSSWYYDEDVEVSFWEMIL